MPHMPGTPTGSANTILIVIRGNSGSGKSSVARELQRRHGRGCALVEQDYLRRIMLRERDLPGGAAPALIAQTVRAALDHGYHVVLEGILRSDHYGDMLAGLRDHRGSTCVVYLDVPLDETLRRHRVRPQAGEFTTADMRSWYRLHDVLRVPGELVLPQNLSIEEAVAAIATAAGLPLAGRTGDFLPLGRGPRSGEDAG
jgi:predicted kinase